MKGATAWQLGDLPWRVIVLAALTMLAFAANSLLTRLALQTTSIDPASLTTARLASGALVLGLIAAIGGKESGVSRANLLPAAFLFIYAAAFAFAYRRLDTGSGALVMFASAQLLMICYGYAKGEKSNPVGVVLALAGLVAFLVRSDSPPPLGASALMMVAGLAWGAFSLLGGVKASPVASTAGSFFWAVPLALALVWFRRHQLHVDPLGLMYATLSGCVTSAIGYVIWYWVRVQMTAISAGTVQLSVPVLSAVLGMIVLDESITAKSAAAAAVVLIGVALTTISARRR